MRNTVCIHHCLAATLGAALFAGALGLPGQAGADPHFVGSAPPPAAAVTASEKAAGRLMVRLRDTVQVASTRRVAAGLGAGSSAKDAIVIVGEAMQQAGVQPASRDPASGKRVATAGKTPAPVRFVRTIGEGTALVQLAGVRDADDLQRVADELTRDPRVAYAVVDRRRRAFAKASGPIQYVPNDPDFGTQWHWHEPMGGIGAARAWPISRGEGIVVAVLDSGILRDHPDLADSRVLPGYDFISDPMVSRRVGFGRVPGAKDQGDWQGQDECLGDGRSAGSTWHGTHVASTIVESGGNGLGMTGLAPKATLLPVRVLGHCGGDDSDIVDAIAWASGGHVDGVMDNDQPAEVLNLSLGAKSECPAPYQEAIDGAIARGTLVVVAAGNDTEDAGTYAPANCRGVVTIGATRITGQVSPFSNHGKRVDLAAPGGNDEGLDGTLGGNIWQATYSGPTTPSSGRYVYDGAVGTSMATAQVSATAALVQSARVGHGKTPLSPARLKALLVATARPFPAIDPEGRLLGRGIVDPATALRHALDPACDPGRERCPAPVGELRNQVPAVIDAVTGGARFVFTAQAGRPLNVMTYGGTGNASLYVRYGAPATDSKYDGRSRLAGNQETVRLAAPKSGTYHVWLPSEPAYRGLTLVVRQ